MSKEPTRAQRSKANREAWAQRQEERDAEREAKKTAKRDPLNDPFTLQMAELKGITPQEFLDLQEAGRKRMAETAKKGTIAEQMARLTPDAPAERLN